MGGNREITAPGSPPTGLLSTQKPSGGAEPQYLTPVADLLLQITGFVPVGSPGARGSHWHLEADLIRHPLNRTLRRNVADLNSPLLMFPEYCVMLNLLKSLRRDEYGVILSTEIVIIGTLLVVGLISGIACLQTSVNNELQDLGGAVDALDQSYSFASIRKSGVIGQCCVYTAGTSYYNDERPVDLCTELVGCIETADERVDDCVEHSCGHGCASCNQGIAPCENRASVPCGDCLRRSGGYRGYGAQSRTGGTRTIDTGVRKMKVTEWPGLAQPVPRVTTEESFPVSPNPHMVPADPNCCGNPHEGLLQQNPPMVVPPVPTPLNEIPKVPAVRQPELSPMPSTEPLPAPQPEPDRI